MCVCVVCRRTYQLKSSSCHELPGLRGPSAMRISQRRIVLEMTGITPTERISARAAVEEEEKKR